MAKEYLKRSLGLWECVFFGVGAILGAGIYALIGKAAGMGGNMVWLAFAIASATALFSAFSYAELSSMFPRAGGEYVYAKNAIGKQMGVVLGMFISLNGIITGATVSLAFAGYFGRLVGIDQPLASIGILCILFFINAAGIRESSMVNILFTVIEMVGLLLIIAISVDDFGKANLLELPPDGVVGLLSAAALSFFAYIGFEEIVKLAEETREPTKNIPRALFLATVITMTMYIAVSMSSVSVMNWEQLSASASPLADILESEWGRAGAIAIAVIALFSTSNTILSNMLGSSRVLFAMAQETRFLKALSTVHSKRKTPTAALMLVVVVMVAFSFIGEIETIAFMANFFIYLTFLIVNASVIVLRLKKPMLHRPFHIPGRIGKVPIFPIIGILLTLVLISFTIYNLSQNIS